MRPSATSIIVLAKSPVPGRVKTRLCPPCTSVEAAEIAAAALTDTLETVASTPAAARLLVLDGPPGPWIPDGFAIVPQLGRGLDERLANAFASVTGPALLIGMDTPQVSREHLVDAAALLRAPGVDAVLGVAVDGGWWGIGLQRADPRVFVGVAMSTDHTGRDQQARLDALGLRTLAVGVLRDVDTYADALEVARAIPESRFGAVMRSIDRPAIVAG